MALPRVSCICLTYGRPWFLEEAIESFLRQDYQGDAELLIMNDYAGQQLIFHGDSRIKVTNCARRFDSIGEKRNATIAAASGEILLTWDDDDIALRGRIRRSVEAIQAGPEFFRPAWSWLMRDDGAPKLVFERIGWPQCAFTTVLFRRAGGYPPLPVGEDKAFALRVAATGCSTEFSKGEKGEATFLYRVWEDNPHASLITLGRLDYAGLTRRVAEKAPIGEITIQPKWLRDYEALCRAAEGKSGS